MMDRISVDRAAAIVSYPIAYVYVYWFMTNDPGTGRIFSQWGGHFFFSLLYIAAVEIYAGACGKRRKGIGRGDGTGFESACLALLILLQSLAFVLYGQHWDDFGAFQILFWHFTCIYYVLARTNALTAGHTGIWFPLDALRGTFGLPFINFFLRIWYVFRGREKKEEDASSEEAKRNAEEREQVLEEKLKKAAILCVSVFFALTAASLAWNELAGASDAFAEIGNGFSRILTELFSFRGLRRFLGKYMPYFFLSLPVGAYLFGLIGGSLRLEKKPEERLEDYRSGIEPMRILPAYSAYMVLGALLVVYLLFFGVQASELVRTLSSSQGASLRELVDVQTACLFAVKGFWQLVRVVLLNFAVLLIFTVCAKVPLWEQKHTRILLDLVFVSSAGLAVLACFKLFVLYFGLYGPTPRRILSGWMAAMQLIWCILALVRFHRRFPSVKTAVYTGAVSFTILCLLDIEKICGIH